MGSRSPWEDDEYIAAEDAARKAALAYHRAEIRRAAEEAEYHKLNVRLAEAWHALTMARRAEFTAPMRDDWVLGHAAVIKAQREHDAINDAIGAHLNRKHRDVGPLLKAKHDAERAARAAFDAASDRAVAALDVPRD